MTTDEVRYEPAAPSRAGFVLVSVAVALAGSIAALGIVVLLLFASVLGLNSDPTGGCGGG